MHVDAIYWFGSILTFSAHKYTNTHRYFRIVDNISLKHTFFRRMFMRERENEMRLGILELLNVSLNGKKARNND